jgi:uncharacterized membrane protein
MAAPANNEAPNPGSRFVVLASAVGMLALALLLYLWEYSGLGVTVLGLVGGGLLVVFIFASDRASEVVAGIVTLGLWS